MALLADHLIECCLRVNLKVPDVQICMRVVLSQMKNGLPALTERSIASSDADRISSSAVSILFLESGPVSSQVCFPHGPKRGSDAGLWPRWLYI